MFQVPQQNNHRRSDFQEIRRTIVEILNIGIAAVNVTDSDNPNDVFWCTDPATPVDQQILGPITYQANFPVTVTHEKKMWILFDRMIVPVTGAYANSHHFRFQLNWNNFRFGPLSAIPNANAIKIGYRVVNASWDPSTLTWNTQPTAAQMENDSVGNPVYLYDKFFNFANVLNGGYISIPSFNNTAWGRHIGNNLTTRTNPRNPIFGVMLSIRKDTTWLSDAIASIDSVSNIAAFETFNAGTI